MPRIRLATAGPYRRLRTDAAAILEAALHAVDPEAAVDGCLRVRGRSLQIGRVAARVRGRLLVAAVGKAAVPMARAAKRRLRGVTFEGLIVSPGPSRVGGFASHQAGHPVPDGRGERAASDLEARAAALGRDDVLLLLLSGGASALLPAPVEGVTLADKAAVTRLLLASGADIREVNVVRKHLSRLKGGGLARGALPARVICLALSDVVGDDLATIGSGPTVADPSTYADAVAVLKTRGLWRRVPAAVRHHLSLGVRGRRPETPKPGTLRRSRTVVIGGGGQAAEAAAAEARRRGYRPRIVTRRLSGEARDVGPRLTAALRSAVRRSGSPPIAWIAAGETTVTVRGRGKGGRNQELALASAPMLAEFRGPAVVASFGTDGIDGLTAAAGGIVDPGSLDRARRRGRDVADHLARNDSNPWLAAANGLLVTGPTGTNVGDLVLLLAAPADDPAAASSARIRRGRGKEARGR